MVFYIKTEKNQKFNEMDKKVLNVYYYDKDSECYGPCYDERDIVYEYISEQKITYDKKYKEYIITKEQYKQMTDFFEKEVEQFNNYGYSDFLGERIGGLKTEMHEFTPYSRKMWSVR